LEQANLNSAEQTVLSGPKEGVDKAEGLAKELGIRKAIRLNVAGAFHSTLMRPAATTGRWPRPRSPACL
jgi:[acyl-carrier-protein] S-malonyltransferase